MRLHNSKTLAAIGLIIALGVAQAQTITSPVAGSGAVSSVFGRTGAVTSQNGDYSVGQVTGAAPSASPVFTGTITTPITGSTQCLHVGTGGVVTGTGSECAIGTVTNLTPASNNIVLGPNPCTGVCTVGTQWLINSQTGTAYPLQSGDAGELVMLNNSSPVSVAFAQSGSAGFTGGWASTLFNRGAGLVTLGPASLVTSTVNGATSITLPQYASADLVADGSGNYNAVLYNMVSSVFGRQGAVIKQSGDYAVADITGAAPLASPTFTGTVTLPASTGTSLVLTGSLTAGAAAVVNFTGESKISSPADGTLLLCNNACNAFTRVLFGGATSSFPALNVSGAGLVCRLADNSANCAFTSGALSASGAVTLTGLTTGSGGVALCLSAANLIYKAPC